MNVKEKNVLRFDDWSKNYDSCILQTLLFKTVHDKFLDELSAHKNIKNSRILDVGCGTGELLFKMSGHSDEIELNGVDLSPDMIRTASSKIAPDVINFKVGDVENLPYENNFFDFITCCRSFHHYPDKKKAVSEMYRILRPDGKLIIADGSREKILGKIIFGYIAKRMEKDVYFMLSHELKDLFRKNGFRKVVQKVFNPLAPLLLTVGTK